MSRAGQVVQKLSHLPIIVDPSHGVQSLKPESFRLLMREIASFAQAAGRRI